MRWTRPKRCSMQFRVPGKVVVDDEVRSLKVDALACGVGGDEHETVLVLGEGLLDGRVVHRGLLSQRCEQLLLRCQKCSETVDEVVERVPVLGEHDELSPVTLCGEHFGAFRSIVEVLAIAVDARFSEIKRELFEQFECLDFVFEFSDRGCGCRCVNDFRIDFVFFVVVEVVVGVDVDCVREVIVVIDAVSGIDVEEAGEAFLLRRGSRVPAFWAAARSSMARCSRRLRRRRSD